ncbi:hypothetical protein NQ315_010325 [Exocentrus adspersus]|uniref:HMG box domain-containing protein n=1 Tax=Exocentrus adspersus TaxID=1586481 RepID=A0AAV8WBA4_9CUCU|nr:hypothetical protein NQ315_010325 [Exocentrus adspersus]
MNAKKGRKNIADASSTNNNKKSKNVLNTNANEEGNKTKNGKRKKENTITSLNENNVTNGNKRKLEDTPNDVVIPVPKKSKKSAKVRADENTECLDIENVQGLSHIQPDDCGIKADLKKNKKKKEPSNDGYISKEKSSKPKEVLQPLLEETDRKKKKLDTTKVKDMRYDEGVESRNYADNAQETDYDAIKPELDYDEIEIHESDLPEVKQEETKISKKKAVITWSKEDLRELVNRMEACLPENDMLSFTTRVEKLDWTKVSFKNYSVEDCKNTWYLLEKKVRRFRLLKEVLDDAKEWIRTPKSKFPSKRMSKHPDMPRKPLTAFFIYYLDRKDAFHNSHPGLDATEISRLLGQEFKGLHPEVRAIYENLAAAKKTEYKKQLEDRKHPEIPRVVRTSKKRVEKKPKLPKLPKPVKVKPPPKERVPKRPPPPFHYYYKSELENQKEKPDPQAFKEICKERWKELADEKKSFGFIKLKRNMPSTKYTQNHPENLQNPHKSILTKEEYEIKARLSGKPIKPPGSAYNLFSRDMLHSEDIKNVPMKERLVFVSNQWKTCPDDTKKIYKDRFRELTEKYKSEYASYLATLPEEERKLEMKKNEPRKRKSESKRPENKEPITKTDNQESGSAANKSKIPKLGSKDVVKKEKVIKTEVQDNVVLERKEKIPKKKSPETKVVSARKLVEPEQPPISPFKYFASLYKGQEPVSQAWKALSAEQKKIYETELIKKKQTYILDFEAFLKSLTPEELQSFSKSREKKSIKKESEDDEESSDESETGESDADSNDDESEDSSI